MLQPPINVKASDFLNDQFVMPRVQAATAQWKFACSMESHVTVERSADCFTVERLIGIC